MLTSPAHTSYTTVGVTGHIDHGKTSLVGKLTGIDCDTHPEEKRRGITIDLGFASLTAGEHVFAFIDAPGHQKYVGNLLAGVSAVDIGLLVVACDQGIQEQTLEHASVLQTLGVPQLVVALSRIDLCDAQRQAEVTEELQVFLTDYGFDEIPVFAVSSVTGEGIRELQEHLCRAAEQQAPVEAWKREGAFRMPIDRVLNVPGRGLVVAGTIWSGGVRVGDQVRLLASSESFRVREIEVHGEPVEQSHCGMRTALNLTGNAPEKIYRGQELLGLDADLEAQRLLVELRMAPTAKPLRCPATVQLHSATRSCEARVTGPKQLLPGEQHTVVVELLEPIAATVEQACLFRLPYPVGTFGGGRVAAVLPTAPLKRKMLQKVTKRLTSHSALSRLEAWVELLGELELTPAFGHQQLAVTVEEIPALVTAALQSEQITQIGDHLVANTVLDRLRTYHLRLLAEQASTMDNAWVAHDSLVERSRHLASPAVARTAIAQLVKAGELVSLNGMLAAATEQTQLSKKQRAKMGELLALMGDNRCPPTSKELATQLGLSSDAVGSLLRHATQQGLLVELGRDLHMGTDALESLLTELAAMFEKDTELTASQIKEGWQLTRKHAIPLLEYLDREQYTSRHQDLRRPGPRLAEFIPG